MSNFIEQLNKITLLEPAALSEYDKEFLRARRDYLTKEQRVKFSEILGNFEKPKEIKPKKPKRSYKK